MTETIGMRLRIEWRLLRRAWLGIWIVAVPAVLLFRFIHPSGPVVVLVAAWCVYTWGRVAHEFKMARLRGKRKVGHGG